MACRKPETLLANALILLCVLFLSGCASSSSLLKQEAEQYNFQRVDLKGQPFTHISFTRPIKTGDPTLHVYIEGDGSPWKGLGKGNTRGIYYALDPTTRSSVIFPLMAIDSQNSLYLGRPCYLGLSLTPPCKPLYWTFERHSSEVVESMRVALTHYLNTNPANEITFIGHSGGGALAMLLAPLFPQTKAVVTLAGNLDIEAWTTHHGYTPLYGSLNPAALPTLPNHIKQIHFAGDSDTMIPAKIIQGALTNQPDGEFILVKGATHTCCWKDIWPDTLKKLDQTQ